MVEETKIKSSLSSFIERVERLNEEMVALRADIKEVYNSAKSEGFDIKVLRQIVKLRSIPADEREEQQQLLDTYISSLGGL